MPQIKLKKLGSYEGHGVKATKAEPYATVSEEVALELCERKGYFMRVQPGATQDTIEAHPQTETIPDKKDGIKDPGLADIFKKAQEAQATTKELQKAGEIGHVDTVNIENTTPAKQQ